MYPVYNDKIYSGYNTISCPTVLTIKNQNPLLVDESYNSSPEALASAIQNLKSLKACNSRVIAILGDMKELGGKEIDFHKNIKQ